MQNLPTKDMDFDTARAILSQRVYEAALFIEQLEDAGKVYGNGHHAAQQIAEEAVNNLKSRWKEFYTNEED